MVISLATVVYSVLAFRHFIQRRRAFSSHLTSKPPPLNATRYLRLMAMSVMQMVVSLAFSAYTLWFTVRSVPMRPWTTWADVHSDFLRVDQFPAASVPDFIEQAYYIIWWLIPISTVTFVAFFSFGREARAEYSKFYASIRGRMSPNAPPKEPVFDSVTVHRSVPSQIYTLPRSLQQSSTSLSTTTSSQISRNAPLTLDYNAKDVETTNYVAHHTTPNMQTNYSIV